MAKSREEGFQRYKACSINDKWGHSLAKKHTIGVIIFKIFVDLCLSTLLQT